MTYDPDANSKGCYDEAISALREKWLVENLPGVKRARVIGQCELLQGDCLEIMPGLGNVDAVVTDPPYGIKRDCGMGGGGVDGFGNNIKRQPKSYAGGWDKERPSHETFCAILDASRLHIIWGGQFFSDMLPPQGKWLFWDKCQTMPSFGDGELCWTSLPGEAVKKFTYNGSGLHAKEKDRVHPTQKPVALMEWCLGFLPHCETILDPFMGSGTTLVACAKTGRRGIGIELDPDYFDIACKRVQQAYSQPDMFIEVPKKLKQEAML